MNLYDLERNFPDQIARHLTQRDFSKSTTSQLVHLTLLAPSIWHKMTSIINYMALYHYHKLHQDVFCVHSILRNTREQQIDWK